jgi:hypothetical protein
MSEDNLPPLNRVSAIVDAELERWLRLKAADGQIGKQVFQAGDWIAVNTAKPENQMTPEGREAIAAAQRRRWAEKKKRQRGKGVLLNGHNPSPPSAVAS